jgi:peptidyl-prolyl cis-trans isomerase SurA
MSSVKSDIIYIGKKPLMTYVTSAIIQLADESAAYRILKLNKKVELHTANLVDDFTTIKDFAVNAKKQEVLLKWINKTISKTFIKLNKGIASCDFKNNWIK